MKKVVQRSVVMNIEDCKRIFDEHGDMVQSKYLLNISLFIANQMNWLIELVLEHLQKTCENFWKRLVIVIKNHPVSTEIRMIFFGQI